MQTTLIRPFLGEVAARFSPGALIAVILAAVLWIYLPAGIYLGGDWLLPASQYQAQNFFFDSYTWSSRTNFGQPSLIFNTGLPYGMFVSLVTAIGIPIEYLGKLVLLLAFTSTYFLFYRLLRYFGAGEIASIAAGLIYVSTPVFFNYAAMGWQFALIAMALFPLAAKWLCIAVRNNDLRYSVGLALIWTLATMQSQSLIWFPALFLAMAIYLVRDRASFQSFLKVLGITFILFLGMNTHWWLGLFLFQDIEVVSSTIVMSVISVGADSRFTALNALRLWGSLFNFQYESAMSNGWVLGSWLLPAFATMAILVSKMEKRRIVLAMGFIAFVLPVALLLLKDHREILLSIPGSGLIRQLSRFTVLTSFAYAVLIGIFLDSLSSAKRFPVRLLLYPAILLLISTSWPWWTGELTNKTASMKPGSDFRLRVKEFPSDYYALEKNLSKIDLASHALYLPYGMSEYKDDPGFRGMFKASVDVFATFSPIPGAFEPSDRPSSISDFMRFIKNNDNIIAATRFTPTNFYILRKNIKPGPSEHLLRNEGRYFPNDSYDSIWSSKNITVYARKYPIPLIYSPAKRQLMNFGEIDSLAEEINSDFAQQGVVKVFASQNYEKKDAITKFVGTADIQNTVEYRKINQTKFRIRLHHVRGVVPLVFGESFSRGWRLYPVALQQEGYKTASVPKHYSIIPGNERYQADQAEVAEFVNSNWVSDMADIERESRFISKRYHGAIQNDYLPEGQVMETWDLGPIPENKHIKVNGYANGWAIDVAQLCSDPQVCRRNEDGSFDTEFVMEFWPQQTFYFGLSITGLTLFFSVTFLLWRRRKPGSSVGIIS